MELEATAPLGEHLEVTLGGQLVDAEVRRFAADPTLVGRRLAQATTSTRWAARR